MSRQTFSRLPKAKEGYFLRRQLLVEPNELSPEYKKAYVNDPLIFYSEDKDEVFKLLGDYDAQGVVCYVENLAGERIS